MKINTSLFICISLQSLFLCLFIMVPKSYAKTDVAIIGALNSEINYFQKYLEQTDIGIDKTTIYKGKIGKNNVVVMQSYVGKVNAAITTQYLIDKYKPAYILNTGTAGSLNSNIKVGTIILAIDLVQFDYDLSADGSAKGYVEMPDSNKKLTTFFKPDIILLNSMMKFAQENSIKYSNSRIGTGDIYITDFNEKMRYKKLFNIDIMDMESAAVAQTAIRNDIPFVVVRIISDFGNNNEYEKNKLTSGELCAKFICDYLLKNKI